MMGELVRLSRENDVYGLSWTPAETIHRYVRVFTLRDVVRGLRRSACELEEMARAGVLLARVVESSYRLVTTDWGVAKRFRFEGLPVEETEPGTEKTGTVIPMLERRCAGAQMTERSSDDERLDSHAGSEK